MAVVNYSVELKVYKDKPIFFFYMTICDPAELVAVICIAVVTGPVLRLASLSSDSEKEEKKNEWGGLVQATSTKHE